jgi:hypothetical protein
MMKNILFVCFLAFISLTQVTAQTGLKQYFDGADTSPSKALFIIRDTAAGNIWQIGKPQKTLFKSASTLPNAIVTDTLNAYPANDTSRFTIKFKDSLFGGSPIIAVRWKQKLDMLPQHSGGVLEFSKNGGAWQNAFNNPNVYNFYGYLQGNKDTLPGGIYAFSGRDTIWRDIWFCVRGTISDSFSVRYSFMSDTSMPGRDGWIIDNMLVQRTFFHTITTAESGRDSKVYPTITNGVIFLEAEHRSQPHFIKSVRILDMAGRTVREYTDEQPRYMIDLSEHPPGQYLVKVNTNLGSETFPVTVRY